MPAWVAAGCPSLWGCWGCLLLLPCAELSFSVSLLYAFALSFWCRRCGVTSVALQHHTGGTPVWLPHKRTNQIVACSPLFQSQINRTIQPHRLTTMQITQVVSRPCAAAPTSPSRTARLLSAKRVAGKPCTIHKTISHRLTLQKRSAAEVCGGEWLWCSETLCICCKCCDDTLVHCITGGSIRSYRGNIH